MKQFLHTKYLILALVIVAVALVTIAILFAQKGTLPSPFIAPPVPTPIEYSPQNPSSLTPLQKAVIGITTDEQIQKMPNLEKTEKLPDGSTRYSFPSEINPRPNQITTKNGTADYERMMTPVSHTGEGYAHLSDFTKKYGQPEKITYAPAFYGDNIRTYIYASKGFVVIGNPGADEAYEIQTFAPMKTADYLNSFGTDINRAQRPMSL